jgi:hypothetical protein
MCLLFQTQTLCLRGRRYEERKKRDRRENTAETEIEDTPR